MRNEKRTEITALSHSSWLKYSNSVTLKVLIHSAEEGGYWAQLPALPGWSLKAKQLGETQISNFGLRNADCLARI